MKELAGRIRVLFRGRRFAVKLRVSFFGEEKAWQSLILQATTRTVAAGKWS